MSRERVEVEIFRDDALSVVGIEGVGGIGIRMGERGVTGIRSRKRSSEIEIEIGIGIGRTIMDMATLD